MRKYLLYSTVFVCGAAVLAVEILGTRIIGPFYGVSLFLWSALISVTLVALSAGYLLGGRLADKIKSPEIMALIIFTAGLLIMLLPFIRNTSIMITASMGLRVSVLTTSIILFFPPLALLGMVSPYAIKLRTESLAEIGRSSGDIYAFSTMGSVAAALVTGFILIPGIGVLKLTLAIGITLILFSLMIFISGRNKTLRIASIILLPVLLFLAIALLYGPGDNNNPGVLAMKQSMYGEIRVMDLDEARVMLIDGGIHTAINKNTGNALLPYVHVLELMKYFREHTGDMLLIGLGGGSVLKSYYYDNWDVEVVEIDPAVTEIASNYFNLNSIPSVIHHSDGREFLSADGRDYDLIIVDAFGSSSVPFHLVTVESFKTAKRRLRERGIIAVNIESLGWHDKIVNAVSATLKQVFRNVLVLPIAEPPNSLGNVIIAASDEALKLIKDLERRYEVPDFKFSPAYEMIHAWDNSFVPENGIVLTDDLNPVDIWSERINLTAREELHKYLGKDSFLW